MFRQIDLGPHVELRYRVLEVNSKTKRETVRAAFMRERDATAYKVRLDQLEKKPV